MQKQMALAVVFFVSACGDFASENSNRGGFGEPAPTGAGEGPDGEASPDLPDPPTANASGTGLQPGTLTAGAWDDNLNLDFYLRYLSGGGSFLSGVPLVPRADRMVIAVTSAQGAPLPGAWVTMRSGEAALWQAPAGADGIVLAFPAWAGVQTGSPLTIDAAWAGASASVQARAGDAGAVVVVDAAPATVAALDVALVLDTTGSMGDEIAYLKTEVAAISLAVAEEFPGVSQRWGLVVYRDQGDDYVTRRYDFTSDLGAFRASLGQQSAGGGGDYPEAMERGLDEAAQLGWREGATARMAFLVADAPHHHGREAALLDAVRAARENGVRIYPIAASGTDERAEFTMRTAAQLTGGRYLFLTDDSGVGGAHKEPRLPCYLVTRLDRAMVRMIRMELTGRRVDPTPAEIIRTGGDPQDGRCTLQDGQVVVAL